MKLFIQRAQRLRLRPAADHTLNIEVVRISTLVGRQKYRELPLNANWMIEDDHGAAVTSATAWEVSCQ
jgi:hypothetical protein